MDPALVGRMSVASGFPPPNGSRVREIGDFPSLTTWADEVPLALSWSSHIAGQRHPWQVLYGFQSDEHARVDTRLALPDSMISPLGIAAGQAGNTADASFRAPVALWRIERKTSAEGWLTLDNRVSPNGLCVSAATEISPVTGAVFAVGLIDSGRGAVWTVRRSKANGEPGSWISVDSFTAFGIGSQARDIAFDRSGNIYVAGYALELRPKAMWWNWLIRRSTDDGSTWQEIDRWPYCSAWPSATK
jgi:Beta-propeller repeat